jgi:hypothetical protein
MTYSASPLPIWLKASAAIDLAQLWCCIRPVIRTELAQPVDHYLVRRWASNHRFFPALDPDGFLVLSRSPGLSRRVLDLDRSPGNHTFALGLALGYPYCCCRRAAAVGDAALDAFAETLRFTDFCGRFKMISPRGYRDGRALISHIPCSSRCVNSLQMAEALARKLNLKPHMPDFLADRLNFRSRILVKPSPVFRRGVLTMIGGGVPSLQFNKIRGREGSR